MEIIVLIPLSLVRNRDIPFQAVAKHGGPKTVHLVQVVVVACVVVGRDAQNLHCDLRMNWSGEGKSSRAACGYVQICIR